MLGKKAFDVICRNLPHLHEDELKQTIELSRSILEILQAKKERTEQEIEQATREDVIPEQNPEIKTRRRRGYKEWKLINGCGPYLYLRVWDGIKLRSFYIGKKDI